MFCDIVLRMLRWTISVIIHCRHDILKNRYAILSIRSFGHCVVIQKSNKVGYKI